MRLIKNNTNTDEKILKKPEQNEKLFSLNEKII